MKTCYIFCALESGLKKLHTDESDLIIAADAGYKEALKIGLKPDIAVGDFDSLKSIPECKNTFIHPTRKDDTDFMLAIKTGLEKGFKRFTVFGALGKRLDHTVGAIQGASFAADNGAFLCLESDGFCVTAIKNTAIRFKKKDSGLISVFALCGEAFGVTIKGLSYETQNITLKPVFPIGVSNEFIGQCADLSVKDGIMTLMWQGQPDDIINIEGVLS